MSELRDLELNFSNFFKLSVIKCSSTLTIEKCDGYVWFSSMDFHQRNVPANYPTVLPPKASSILVANSTHFFKSRKAHRGQVARLERHPIHQKVAGLIPVRAQTRVWVGALVGVCTGGN